MAYIRQELLGSAGRRPPIHRRKPALIKEMRANMVKNPGRMKFSGGRPMRPTPSKAQVGPFNMGGDIMGPENFPTAIGSQQPDDSWFPAGGFPRTAPSRGGFNDSGPELGPPMHPAFTGFPQPPFRGEAQRPPWEGQLNQQALIQMIMEQIMGQRSRPGPPAGSYM